MPPKNQVKPWKGTLGLVQSPRGHSDSHTLELPGKLGAEPAPAVLGFRGLVPHQPLEQNPIFFSSKPISSVINCPATWASLQGGPGARRAHPWMLLCPLPSMAGSTRTGPQGFYSQDGTRSPAPGCCWADPPAQPWCCPSPHLSQTLSKKEPLGRPQTQPGGTSTLWILGRCSSTSRPHRRAQPGLITNEAGKGNPNTTSEESTPTFHHSCNV